MAIKAAAARPWAGRNPTTTTWYEPYTTRDEVGRGVAFALSTPGVQALCTPSDLGLVSLVLDIVGTEEPVALSTAEREACIGRDPGRNLDLPDARRLTFRRPLSGRRVPVRRSG